MIDDYQNDRLADLEARMRLIEKAVIELGVMSNYIKIGVAVLAASVGLDITAVV